MKKLIVLVLMCASVFAYSESYASVKGDLPITKNSKSVKAAKSSAGTSSKSHNLNKSHDLKKIRRQQHGYNYYKYANRHSYLKAMGKEMNR